MRKLLSSNDQAFPPRTARVVIHNVAAKKPEFVPRRSRLSRRKHALSFDERFWERLGVVADKHYGGNRSRALEGLLLHDWLVELNKTRDGKEHTHWISAPMVLNDGELEPLLDRLERGEADAVGCYIDRLVEERMQSLRSGPERSAEEVPPSSVRPTI